MLGDVDAAADPQRRPELRRPARYGQVASTCPVCGHAQLFSPDQVERMCRLVVHHRCPLCKKLSTVDEWLFPLPDTPAATTDS